MNIGLKMMNELEVPKSRIFYSEKGKLIYYPFEDFKDRARVVFDSKDCGEVILEANTLQHVIIDFLSENPLEKFSTKELIFRMLADGRFIDHDIYKEELPKRVGKKLTYLVKHFPSKISATKDHNNYQIYDRYAYYLYKIIEPFTKRKGQNIIYS